MPRSARCPACHSDFPEAALQRTGILHCREEARGGPFYTFACLNCGQRLAAERDGAYGYRVRAETDLAGSPRVLRALRAFLASPRQSSNKAPTRNEPVSRRPPPAKAPSAPRWNLAERRLLEQLGLPLAIGPSALKRRYRAFVKAEHPDRHLDKPAAERRTREATFIRLNETYRRLLSRCPE